MTVYQAIVQIGAAHPNHCSVTLREGTQVMVDGEPMVRTASGYIEPTEYWEDTIPAAYKTAAMQIEGAARELLARADSVRAKAVDLQSQEAAA